VEVNIAVVVVVVVVVRSGSIAKVGAVVTEIEIFDCGCDDI
jgi:hypothetical protein